MPETGSELKKELSMWKIWNRERNRHLENITSKTLVI